MLHQVGNLFELNVELRCQKVNTLYTEDDCWPGSSVGIAIELRAGLSGDRIPMGVRFSARPDRPWGPPSLLYNGYRVFSVGKVQPRRAAEHSPFSCAEVLKE
jgi:hypothetical protein